MSAAAKSSPPNEFYPHLFSPVRIGSRTLPNRIVHASMSTRFAENGKVTQKLIDYFVVRAAGGASLLVTEPLNVTHRQRDLKKVMVQTGENAEGLADWAAQVRKAGGIMIGQLQDPGRGRHKAGRSASAISASALPDDMSWTVPYVPTTEELEVLIGDFVSSSKKLCDAGFGGIEVSAGHGHLFHQFMASGSNQRTDRFGGDQRDRCTIVVDIIEGVRAACGDDFIIGLKLPGEDGMPGGIDMDAALVITQRLHETGCADYLTYCWGAHSNTLDWHLPDMHGDRTPYVEQIAELAKAAPGVPVGALGLITDPNEGDRIVRDDQADLVMLGRPLVTDSAWGLKAAAGREAEIRYCVSCNSCWGAIILGSGLACDNNPRVGEKDDLDWQPPKTANPRKIAVVGGGIAGMEAAWIARARGHDVTVFTTSEEVGGNTRLHAELPGGEHLSSIYDYQRLQADRHGVKYVVGPRATLDQVLADSPDAVVLATGSTPSWPAYVPEDYRDEDFFPDVRRVARMFLDRTSQTSGTAVIYDCDHGAFTYAVAELLSDRFDRVVLVTPREAIAQEEPIVNRQGINRRIYAKGVEVVTWSEPVWTDDIEEGALRLRHILTGAEQLIEDVALMTHATARIPNNELAAGLQENGIEHHLIGDCYAPRTVLVATAEGYRLGVEV